MKNRIRFSLILYFVLAAWLSLAPLLAQTTTRRPGQSATLLPNGSWLLVGGEEQGLPLPTAAILNPLTKAVKALPNQLQDARAWHTATLLPDGTVLVLGGVGADGQITDVIAHHAIEPAHPIATA